MWYVKKIWSFHGEREGINVWDLKKGRGLLGGP